MRFLTFFAALLMTFAAHLAPAAAQSATVPAAQAPTIASASAGAERGTLQDGYVIGINDSLDVGMVGSDEFRGRVQVQQDGTITLPFIGSLRAQDKTLLQLGREIAAALSKGGYYIDPAIQVSVAQISSRYVTVLGEVSSPGLIPLDRAYRASEMIARVGGIKPTGAETFYLRREGGVEIPLTLEQIARGGDATDPVVNPGDKIFVPQAPTFYIYGQVNAPGTYSIQNKMNLRMALARSGGLTSLGSDKRITIVRGGEELKKFSLNDPITKDDVIVVGERFF
jgi:polysaccharide export outer membrane protein